MIYKTSVEGLEAGNAIGKVTRERLSEDINIHADKHAQIATSIHKLRGVVESLDHLVNRITGQEEPEQGSIAATAPVEPTLLEFLNEAPRGIDSIAEKAFERINNIRELLF